MSEQEGGDSFAPPSRQARAAALALIEASLNSQPAEIHSILNDADEFGAMVHATLNLLRAFALRLRTPDAMSLIDLRFAEVAEISEDRYHRIAAQLLLGHAQTSRVPPADNSEIMLHNLGAETFNAAVDAADEIDRSGHVLIAALNLWRDLLIETACSPSSSQILRNVADELWGELGREEPPKW